MKNRTIYLSLLSFFLLAGFSPVLAQFDDLYYDPDTDYNPSSNDYYSENNYDSEYNTNYDAEYYDYEQDDFFYEEQPYFYSSRIRRFHRSYYGFDYYDPCYVDAYYYGYDPMFFNNGVTVLIYSDSWNYRRWRRWNRRNFWYGPGFYNPGRRFNYYTVNNFYGGGFGWGYNNWGYNNWGYNGWGNNWGYNGWGYNN